MYVYVDEGMKENWLIKDLELMSWRLIVPCIPVAVQGTQLVDSLGGTGGVSVALALGSSDGEGEGSAQLLWVGTMRG